MQNRAVQVLDRERNQQFVPFYSTTMKYTLNLLRYAQPLSSPNDTRHIRYHTKPNFVPLSCSLSELLLHKLERALEILLERVLLSILSPVSIG